jgi:hypothetical protein
MSNAIVEKGILSITSEPGRGNLSWESRPHRTPGFVTVTGREPNQAVPG